MHTHLTPTHPADEAEIRVVGAREHNLKDVSINIPRNQLVVITGVSGSGNQPGLDTLYAEGQRRYLETFSAYARQFLGGLERPKVDQITGLSPVISIEQKTISKNPRSTVGTITEVHDFLRLIYARAADAFSLQTGEAMIRFTDEEILDRMLQDYHGQRILLLAPLVKGRKGHYRELFESVMKQGYVRARIDGALVDSNRACASTGTRCTTSKWLSTALKFASMTKSALRSIKTALNLGKGNMGVTVHGENAVRHFSRHLMCPTTGDAYPDPEPNLFSFNSPYGACPQCNGLGEVAEAELSLIIPDDSKSIQKGASRHWATSRATGPCRSSGALDASGDTLKTPIKDLAPEVVGEILYGSKEHVWVPGRAGTSGATSTGKA